MIEPHTPRWHSDRRGGPRAELVDALCQAVHTDVPDAPMIEVRGALESALAGWSLAYEQGLFDTEAPDPAAAQVEADEHPQLRIVATSPPRALTAEEEAARAASLALIAARERFREWVRTDADVPDAVEPTPFGRDVVDRLALLTGQRSWWCDAEFVWRRVEGMEPDHRRSLLAVFRKRAATLHISHAMTHGLSNYDGDAPDDPETADEWLARQPLVERLVELVAADYARGVHGPIGADA